ncbi:AAA family ATPase [Actinopolymorpha sp. B9G3]|uniref:AAA family ATPase n=1 Tax=Actinopolymorpha sp. B9G3 TaxID=3158970 RepID=UPI0032D998EC
MVDFDCPACGAGAPLQVVATDRITCGPCSTARSFRQGQLYVITGSPGTGKSSVGRELAARLPLELVVLDSDLTSRPEHDSSEGAWFGFIDTWLRTAVGVAQSGHSLILVGYSMPHQWEHQALRHFLGPITYVALVCSDAELERRLRQRTWMGSQRERDSLIDLNRQFRAHGDMTVIETDSQPPDAIADQILSIVSSTSQPPR